MTTTALIPDLLAAPPEWGSSTHCGPSAAPAAMSAYGANVVSHGRYTTFQMAEVTVPRQRFQETLMLIAQLRAPPAPA